MEASIERDIVAGGIAAPIHAARKGGGHHAANRAVHQTDVVGKPTLSW